MTKRNTIGMKLTIQQLNELPPAELRFKHFVNLKSGSDSFSEWRLSQLQANVDHDDVVAVEKQITDPVWQAKAYRWILRGLSTSLAILKVQTDIEVNTQAMLAKQPQEKNLPSLDEAEANAKLKALLLLYP